MRVVWLSIEPFCVCRLDRAKGKLGLSDVEKNYEGITGQHHRIK